MLLSHRASFVAIASSLACFFACGSRSELVGDDPGPALGGLPLDEDPSCAGDLDCQGTDRCFPSRCEGGRCVDLAPIDCDDGDDCTRDRCDPVTGTCSSEPLAFDRDGDGFRGPRPGFAPGAPGSCGEDCDDSSPLAFPGGRERCDGVDNDCNGIVDEDAAYVPTGDEPILVAEGARQSSVGGIAFDGEHYAAVFASQYENWQNTFKGLAADGTTAVPGFSITNQNADSFTGPVVWTGDEFAIAWEDRRDGDFEIYFNRVDAGGNKLGPDVRVTEARDFSLRPDLMFNGVDYVLVWSDRRRGRGDYRIYGQRIGAEGGLIGDNVELTGPGLNAEGPSVAEGSRALGLTFNMEGPTGRQVAFQLLEPDLSSSGDFVIIGPQNAVGASLVYNARRFVAAWHERDVVPGDAIYGAALDEDGTVVIPERPLTDSAPFARSHSILPLGDRLLLVWAEERFGSFDLFTKMLTSELGELTPPTQVTFSPSDAVNPVAVFGPDGDVGILFEDLRSGSWQVYFIRLSCRVGGS